MNCQWKKQHKCKTAMESDAKVKGITYSSVLIIPHYISDWICYNKLMTALPFVKVLSKTRCIASRIQDLDCYQFNSKIMWQYVGQDEFFVLLVKIGIHHPWSTDVCQQGIKYIKNAKGL